MTTKSKNITVSNKCQRVNCNGTIVDDGDGFAICNLCGRPPVISEEKPGNTPPAGGTGPAAGANKPAENIAESVKTDGKITQNVTSEIPPKPYGRGIIVAQYYDKYKDRILADIQRLGKDEALKLWKMNRWVFGHCEARWNKQQSNRPADNITDASTGVAQERPHLVPVTIQELRPDKTRGYLIEYWRKEAELECYSSAESLIMNLTADTLEATHD